MSQNANQKPSSRNLPTMPFKIHDPADADVSPDDSIGVTPPTDPDPDPNKPPGGPVVGGMVIG